MLSTQCWAMWSSGRPSVGASSRNVAADTDVVACAIAMGCTAMPQYSAHTHNKKRHHGSTSTPRRADITKIHNR